MDFRSRGVTTADSAEQVGDAKCTRPFLPLVKGLAPRLELLCKFLGSLVPKGPGYEASSLEGK